jgi:hypothetical protein
MKSTQLTIGKYVVLSFLAMGIALTSCKKDDPVEEPADVTSPAPEPTFSAHSQVQVPIVLKETGELCPPCGGWGWTNWETLINDYKSTAFKWANYSNYFVSNSFFVNSELDPANSVQNAFQANFPYGGSKPLIYVNGSQASSNTGAAQVTDSKVKIDQSINTDAANVKVSAAYKIKWEGNKITVDAQAKFYQNTGGAYYMGVYLVEDKVMATQSGQSGTVAHHLAMRGSVEGGVWGKEIVSGMVSQDDVFDETYTTTIPSTYNKENITVGVIIWRKNGTKYFYENAATNQE